MTRSNKVISVGVDKMIKIWDSDEFNEENSIISIVGSSPFTSGRVLKLLPVKCYRKIETGSGLEHVKS